MNEKELGQKVKMLTGLVIILFVWAAVSFLMIINGSGQNTNLQNQIFDLQKKYTDVYGMIGGLQENVSTNQYNIKGILDTLWSDQNKNYIWSRIY